MFKNLFSYEGRIRRTEYGVSYLIYLIILAPLNLITRTSQSSATSLIFLIIWLPLVYILICQGAKRCHDRGNSGWYQLIPFYGLWMLFGNSDFGPNEYGPNPKGEGNKDPLSEIGKRDY
ncbi:DUF805 domain-containing protein [Chryseobacterium sp. T1]